MNLLTSNVFSRYDLFTSSTCFSSKSNFMLKAESPILINFSFTICANGIARFIYFLRDSFLPKADEIILLSGKTLLFSYVKLKYWK